MVLLVVAVFVLLAVLADSDPFSVVLVFPVVISF